MEEHPTPEPDAKDGFPRPDPNIQHDLKLLILQVCQIEGVIETAPTNVFTLKSVLKAGRIFCSPSSG